MPTIHGTEVADNLSGTSGDDIINGLGGIDIVRGLDGNDTIDGGTGNDNLKGDAGDDIIVGGDGNDQIYGGRGVDIVDGGAGDDILWVNPLDIAPGDQIYGGSGFDILKLYGQFDFVDLTGVVIGSDVEVIDASDRPAIITADRLMQFSGISGLFRIVGGGTLDFTGISVGHLALSLEAGGSFLQLVGQTPEGLTVYGGNGNDTIIGNDVGETLLGHDGDDHLEGGGGDDILRGELGADLVDGGDGDDLLQVFGGTYVGVELSVGDQFIGGAGYDTIQFYSGGSGWTYDATVVDIASDVERIIADAQVTVTYERLSQFQSASGSFRLTGTGTYDFSTAFFGNGTLWFGAGDDTVTLAGNAHSVVSINAGGGADHVIGGDLRGTIEGQDGNDWLEGRAGNDFLDGGAGDDLIDGGTGDDDLKGGTGRDTFVVGNLNDPTERAGSDRIFDFNATHDQIDLRAYEFKTFGDVLSRTSQIGDDTVIRLASGENLTLSHFQMSTLTTANFVGIIDSMDVTLPEIAPPPPPPLFTDGDNQYRYVATSDAPDSIDMLGGYDWLIIETMPAGGLTVSGVEKISFLPSFSSNFNAGPITLIDFDTANGFIGLTDGLRPLFAAHGWYGVYPSWAGLVKIEQVGDDAVLKIDLDGTGDFIDLIVFKNTSATELDLGNFGMPVDGPPTGIEFVGTGADEQIYGTGGDDHIVAGDGNDSIFGGHGRDILTGGAGADTFTLLALGPYYMDRPTITDFNAAEDRLDLRALGVVYFSDVLARAYQDGASVVFEITPMCRLTLENVQLSDLRPENFVGLLPGSAIALPPPAEILPRTIEHVIVAEQPVTIPDTETIVSYLGGQIVAGIPANGENYQDITNNGVLFNYADDWAAAFGYGPLNIVNNGSTYSVGQGGAGSVFIGGVDSVSANLTNTGLMVSTSYNGYSIGYSSHSGGVFYNSGTISARGNVLGDFTSFGVLFEQEFDSFLNDSTGQIIVEAPSALGVYLGAAYPTAGFAPLVNNGSIISVSTSHLASIGVYLSRGHAVLDLDNSGLIRADIAVYCYRDPFFVDDPLASQSAAAYIVNETGGQIYGDMLFATRSDTFINRGYYEGDIYAAEADDLIDTSGGRIVGTTDLGKGNDLYVGGDFGDIVFGGDGNDHLIGGGGDDILDGGLGGDAMEGGDGDDTYFVDFGTDVVIDTSGFDTVYTSTNYVLAAGIENLIIIGSRALNGTGNALDNLLVGNDAANLLNGASGNDIIYGGGGADTLTGGAGIDYFLFDTDPGLGIDVITDFDASSELIYLDRRVFNQVAEAGLSFSAFGEGAVATTTQQRILYDIVTGNIAYDPDGNGAAAAMVFARVNPGTNLTFSNFVGFMGDDSAAASSITYALTGSQISLTLTGADAINGTGNALDNLIVGNAAVNRISGLGGNDELWGAAGDDLLFGGGGHDALFGEVGDDRLEGGAGDDFLDGGKGVDTADYSRATTGVTVDLSLVHAQWTGAGWDYLRSIECVVGSNYDDTLIGNDAANVLTGGDGNDRLITRNKVQDNIYDGGAGSDTVSYELNINPVTVSLAIEGSQQVDFFHSDTLISIENLVGGNSSDVLTGNDGDNFLMGGGGSDTLEGGAGNDVLLGSDQVDAWNDDNFEDSASYAGATSAVTVSLLGTDGIAQDTLGAGIDILQSIESLIGSAWNDTLSGSDGRNTLNGEGADDLLVGYGGDDRMYGGEGTDTLVGGNGADYLYGGAGADHMSGGLGDDNYEVDDAADLVVEIAGEGLDGVLAWIDYVLPANVEALLMGGNEYVSASINGTGNGLDNALRGNFGDNVLSGLGGDDYIYGNWGNDRLIGGAGDDILEGWYGDDVLMGGAGNDRLDGWGGYDVASYKDATAGVTVSLALVAAQNTGGAGIDTLSGIEGLEGSNYNDWLSGTADVDTLSGLAGDDILKGGAGSDLLTGGAGLDKMYGGVGDDTYVVSDLTDYVFENAGEGYDTVLSSISLTLRDHVEVLTLTGAGNIFGRGNGLDNVITGNGGANKLYGLDGNDTLYGGAGNDLLDGGLGGADRMVGGTGNDIYYVRDTGDTVVELLNQGTDLVYTGLGYTLGADVENLTLTGSAGVIGRGNALHNLINGNDGANKLFGFDGDDRLYGRGGNDTIDAGAGVDRMWGGEGNDTYYVHDATDYVFEYAGQGTDIVYADVSLILRANIENLTLTGTADTYGKGNGDNNVITGNAGANKLFGLGGNDRLDGGAGNDLIDGGAGQDVTSGGAGADLFVFGQGDFSGASAATADRILDFSQADGDRIRLSTVDANTTLAGDQTFAFIGTGAFSHTAGELRYQQIGSNTFLMGDTDGDGTADFWIRLDGLHTMTQGDLIL